MRRKFEEALARQQDEAAADMGLQEREAREQLATHRSRKPESKRQGRPWLLLALE